MSRSEFESLLQTDGHPPVVFHHAVDQWPAMQWTEQYLAERLQGKQFQCKISPICHEDVLMETECLHVECSLQQYDDWLSRQQKVDSPLSMFDPSKYSCYVDYKYMKDMFKDSPDVLKEVSWEMFGFPGREGTASTIWIGSMGAYTPCHQDTYGFNLVAQIKGSKRWYLFPPAATSHMYPTRVPYEESSVFSEVNVRNPDLKKHPLFQGAEPYIVVLQPGDVLYVPRHWWHFVECLETSISVNTWVEMEGDVYAHLHEAVTRFLFTSMADIIPADSLLNIYEEIEPSPVNISYIKQAVQAVIENNNTRTKNQSEESDSEQPLASRETDLQTTNNEYLQSRAPEPQADESSCKLSYPSTVNNFCNFSNAFKGHMVTLCGKGFYQICSDRTSRKERKRRHLMNQLGNDQTMCCPLPEDYETGACSKYAKLEHESTMKKILTSGSEGNGQDINSETTNTEKQVLQISAVSKLSFKEYLAFLKKEFDYDEIEYGTVDSSSGHDEDRNKIVDPRDVVGSFRGNAVSVFTENTNSVSSRTTQNTDSISSRTTENTDSISSRTTENAGSISSRTTQNTDSISSRTTENAGSISSRTINSHEDSSIENIDTDEQKRINRSRRDDTKGCIHRMEDDRKPGGQNDRFALKVINSVLDHNVISAICQNLMKKYKD